MKGCLQRGHYRAVTSLPPKAPGSCCSVPLALAAQPLLVQIGSQIRTSTTSSASYAPGGRLTASASRTGLSRRSRALHPRDGVARGSLMLASSRRFAGSPMAAASFSSALNRMSLGAMGPLASCRALPALLAGPRARGFCSRSGRPPRRRAARPRLPRRRATARPPFLPPSHRHRPPARARRCLASSLDCLRRGLRSPSR